MDGYLVAWDIGAALTVAVFAVLLVLLAPFVRRWLFERAGGTVECSLRLLSSGPSGGCGGVGPELPGVWHLGIGRYKRDELQWHRVFGFRTRPRQVIHRRGLVVSNRRGPEGDEEVATLTRDAGIIEVCDGDVRIELAMSAAALTGFLAWLEAAPPGFPVDLPGPAR